MSLVHVSNVADRMMCCIFVAYVNPFIDTLVVMVQGGMLLFSELMKNTAFDLRMVDVQAATRYRIHSRSFSIPDGGGARGWCICENNRAEISCTHRDAVR